MKKQRITDEELLWAAYLEVPEETRMCKDISEMSEQAKATWLAIAKRQLACGWDSRRVVEQMRRERQAAAVA